MSTTKFLLAVAMVPLVSGCSGGSSASNADVAADAKEMADKGKGAPTGPPLQTFGSKPGVSMKPHGANP